MCYQPLFGVSNTFWCGITMLNKIPVTVMCPNFCCLKVRNLWHETTLFLWDMQTEEVYLQFFHQSVGWWPLWGLGEASGNRRCWWSTSGCVCAHSATLHAGSPRSTKQTGPHVSDRCHHKGSEPQLCGRFSTATEKTDRTGPLGWWVTTDLQPLLKELHASLLSVGELIRKAPVSNQENHGLRRKGNRATLLIVFCAVHNRLIVF